MTNDPHGWKGYWELYREGRWEPGTRSFMETCLRPGDLFVDVGAWIGPCSIWAHSLGAYALAVEPDPVAYAELEKRVPDAHEVAITIRGGLRVLLPNPKEGGAYGDSMSRLGRGGEPPGNGLVVETMTLPGLLKYHKRPSLVKIDVEGYEMALMRSLGPWLSDRRIPVQVSCHGQLIPAASLAGYANVDWPNTVWGDVRAWT
jgi:FkbM family methyltransferase